MYIQEGVGMKIRVVFGESPPKDRHFTLKNPYTEYSKPDFLPHHYYEIIWFEYHPEKTKVISKIEFSTFEECKKAYEIAVSQMLDVSDVESDINERMEQTRQMARENRENFIEIMTTDDFYPTALWEYMDRLRRKKYVKDKRRREKQKILAMMPNDAKIYLEKKLKELENDENKPKNSL